MPVKQQNRYCGVVLKTKGKVPILPSGFSKNSDQFYLKSTKPIPFDGYIPGIEIFSHDQIATYKGSWSMCEILDDKFILSRDRVGVRSVYYWESDNYFAFANEIKGLLELPFIPFIVSMQGAHEFFFSGRTCNLIEGIKELEAGHILEFNTLDSTFKKSAYFQETEESLTLESTEEEILQYLRNSISNVTNQVSEDQRNMGSFLSGGVDSSVIAASLALNNKQNKIPFITAMTEDETLNEDNYAAEVVKSLGISEWHQVVGQNIDKEVEQLHYAMELPTTSMGSYLQYELMRFCNYKGITDVLDGTGADALFAGHNYHFPIYANVLLKKGKVGGFIGQIRNFPLGGNPIKYYFKNILKYYYFPRFSNIGRRKMDLGNNPLLLGLSTELLNLEMSVDPIPALNDMNRFLSYEFYGGAVSSLLRFNDRIGRYFGVMNHSIFSEYPEIYEYALKIPPEFKIKNGYSKYILRNAFSDLLPKKVLERKLKMGLVAPNNHWLKKHKALFLSYFTDDLSPFFKVAKMKELINKAIDESDALENYKIFKFISFAIWYKVMNK